MGVSEYGSNLKLELPPIPPMRIITEHREPYYNARDLVDRLTWMAEAYDKLVLGTEAAETIRSVRDGLNPALAKGRPQDRRN